MASADRLKLVVEGPDVIFVNVRNQRSGPCIIVGTIVVVRCPVEGREVRPVYADAGRDFLNIRGQRFVPAHEIAQDGYIALATRPRCVKRQTLLDGFPDRSAVARPGFPGVSNPEDLRPKMLVIDVVLQIPHKQVKFPLVDLEIVGCIFSVVMIATSLRHVKKRGNEAIPRIANKSKFKVGSKIVMSAISTDFSMAVGALNISERIVIFFAGHRQAKQMQDSFSRSLRDVDEDAFVSMGDHLS